MRRSILSSLLIAILQLRTPRTEAVNVTGIRLVNQVTGNVVQQTGTVQIQLDGNSAWGHVCDDAFENDEAVVVCRMLGFTNGGTAITQQGFPPNALQQFFLDDTGCAGDEPTLTECIAAQVPDCSPATDNIIGVVCNDNRGPGEPTEGPRTTTPARPDVIEGICQQGTNPDPNVRLYGKEGVAGMGFVEVRNPNNPSQWGFVCDDFWDSNDALVVCRELCYNTNLYTPKPSIPAENVVYPTSVNIVKDDVECVGDEQSLVNCPSSAWGVDNCVERELAGVQCLRAEYEPPPPPIPILLCREGLMIAQFSRQQDENLEEKHLVVYNNGAECNDVIKSTNDDYVVIQIPVDKCGTTNTQTNTSHIVYQNTISYLYTSLEGSITRKNTYQVRITCSIPTSIAVTQRVQPLTETVTQKATGLFATNMAIYRNDSFEVPVVESPVRIPLGEWLNMAVIMEDNDPNLKVVLTDCIATPTGNTNQEPLRRLITDKCPEEETISVYPLSNFRMGFRFKPFKFVGHDLLYVHCDALVCRSEDQTRLCDRTCNNGKPETSGKKRKKRAIFDKFIMMITSPAIVLYDPSKPGSAGNSGKDDSVSIVTVANKPSAITNNFDAGENDKPVDKPNKSDTGDSSKNTVSQAVATTTEAATTIVALQQPPSHSNTLHVSDSESLEPDSDDRSNSGSASNSRPTPPSSLSSRNMGCASLKSAITFKHLVLLIAFTSGAMLVGG